MKRALFVIGFCIVASVALAPVAVAKGWHHAHRDRQTASSGEPSVATGPMINATPAMWTVHGPKGTAYLLGSIHVLPKNVNWQTPEITAAMKRADTFVFELPMDADNRLRLGHMFAHNGLMPISQSLPTLFDQQMRTEYRQVIDRTHADASLIVYLRPWLAALVLQGASDGAKDFTASEGVDNKVYALADARGVKNYRSFETDELQMHLLMGGGTTAEQLKALELTFKEIIAEHHDGPTMHNLLDAWAKGDTKTLASIGPDNKEMAPDVRKAMLEDRNRAWIPQIVGMLNEKHTYFITVGAAHLVGSIGVPNLLRAEGYKVDGP